MPAGGAAIVFAAADRYFKKLEALQRQMDELK